MSRNRYPANSMDRASFVSVDLQSNAVMTMVSDTENNADRTGFFWRSTPHSKKEDTIDTSVPSVAICDTSSLDDEMIVHQEKDLHREKLSLEKECNQLYVVPCVPKEILRDRSNSDIGSTSSSSDVTESENISQERDTDGGLGIDPRQISTCEYNEDQIVAYFNSYQSQEASFVSVEKPLSASPSDVLSKISSISGNSSDADEGFLRSYQSEVEHENLACFLEISRSTIITDASTDIDDKNPTIPQEEFGMSSNQQKHSAYCWGGSKSSDVEEGVWQPDQDEEEHEKLKDSFVIPKSTIAATSSTDIEDTTTIPREELGIFSYQQKHSVDSWKVSQEMMNSEQRSMKMRGSDHRGQSMQPLGGTLSMDQYPSKKIAVYENESSVCSTILTTIEIPPSTQQEPRRTLKKMIPHSNRCWIYVLVVVFGLLVASVSVMIAGAQKKTILKKVPLPPPYFVSGSPSNSPSVFEDGVSAPPVVSDPNQDGNSQENDYTIAITYHPSISPSSENTSNQSPSPTTATTTDTPTALTESISALGGAIEAISSPPSSFPSDFFDISANSNIFGNQPKSIPQMIQETIPLALEEDEAMQWILYEDPLQLSMEHDNPAKILQRYILMVLYFSTTNWKRKARWGSGKDECTWYGISCNSMGFVTSLIIENNKISGLIPEEIGYLEALETLSLNENYLYGAIPSSIGGLSNLENLHLHTNLLYGTIPDILGHLPTLANLTLYTNKLSGTIPSSLGNLSILVGLGLHRNYLNGTIPSSLANLTKLEQLYVQENFIYGTIPDSFGQMSNLVTFFGHDNQLSGAIPSSFGNLTNLDTLYLDSNDLSGTIPSSFGTMSSLVDLRLYNNQLSGTMPSSLGNLTNLHVLYLDDNEIHGTIPSSLGNIKGLETLWLCNNHLDGYIPTSLGDLIFLDELLLHNNSLNGQIQSSICNLTTSQLTADCGGEIPEVVCECCDICCSDLAGCFHHY